MVLDKQDYELLIHTKCQCFYEDQEHRFEHHKGNIKNINKKGMFNWVDNDLTALFVYHYYKNKKYKPVLLWDLASEEWCIFTNQNWNKYISRSF
tara:strand:- start:50 stop:331 length:282 start_codon:yes stop_codon:yes gene_type:complete